MKTDIKSHTDKQITKADTESHTDKQMAKKEYTRQILIQYTKNSARLNGH